jgi:cell shape-determining protein MreC
MASRPRQLLTAAIVLVITLVLSWSGAWRAAWQHLAGGIAPWQRELSPILGAEDSLENQLIASREQLVQLSAENVLLRTRLAEYLAIRGEGGIPPEQLVVVRTRIIGRTQRQGRRFLELDAGAVDGVTKGMAVCAGWSLVGMVAGVQEGRCLIQQLSDSESRIPAMLMDGEKIVAEGVLAGSGKRASLMLDFIEDRGGIEVTRGMHVVSAGSDTRLPPGLVIGVVSASSRSSTANHWHIEVTPLRVAEACESLLVMRFAGPPR